MWFNSVKRGETACKNSLQIVDVQRVKEKDKINEIFFQKELEVKEKGVSLHSQNNGNGVEEKEGKLFGKFFERMIQAKSER